MAIENLNFVVGHLAAAANYSATGQYRGMVASTSANHTAVLASAAGQQIIGILRNEPEAGDACEIVASGIAKGIAGGTIVRGDRLTVDANGAFVAATGTGHIAGQALESASSGELVSILLQQKPVSKTTLCVPFLFASIPNGDILTNLPVPGPGRVVGFRAAVTSAVTTASRGMNINLEIGTTNLTGGVIGLTSANSTPLGAVIASSAITGANVFAAGDTLSIEGATGAGAFAEGQGVFFVDLKLFERKAKGD